MLLVSANLDWSHCGWLGSDFMLMPFFAFDSALLSRDYMISIGWEPLPVVPT